MNIRSPFKSISNPHCQEREKKKKILISSRANSDYVNYFSRVESYEASNDNIPIVIRVRPFANRLRKEPAASIDTRDPLRVTRRVMASDLRAQGARVY